MYTEREVDSYILDNSRLRKTSRGYKALKLLLEEGHLLYWCLGKNDTLELAKVLIFLKCRYEHVSGGLQIHEENKRDFYYNVMYPKPKEVQPNYFDYRANRLGKAEPDEDKMGWAEKILMNKEKDK